ncbi:AbfB domain-containing protein [Micromonospora sediminicola]|uniref:AbfB domain-containing protein n=1 Tax=Micromonospora sediminicola TaxID=946078 RepID=UPI001C3FFBBC|nr:AbfB domain-containing protein [Micromonospora sediminicola]
MGTRASRLVVVTILALTGVVAALTAPGAARPATAASGTPVDSQAALYPRAVRLTNSGTANGRVILTVTQFPAGGPVAGIYESTTDGPFRRVGTVTDPVARQGLCCSTLFELPRPLGGLPAGTLLWAGSVGQDGGIDRRMSIRVWASNDVGRTWRYLSTVAQASNAGGLWEPEFFVDAAGRLVAHLADESQPGRSQVLVQSISTDGLTWSPRSPIVTGPQPGHRPGMPAVRRMPDGTYLLAYEVCGFGGQYDCAVRFRTSADGTTWGDPARLDPLVQTADGRYLTATPTLATTATGRVLLVAQRVRNADGTEAVLNGRALFVNLDNGRGSWYPVPAPVAVPDARPGVCPNYSSTLVSSADGSSLSQVSTDDAADGTCRAYSASALLPPASARPGRLAGAAGTCVDVAGGGTANGAAVQLWQCNDAPVQRWTLRPDGSIGAQGRCLDVPGMATGAGTRLQIWECNGSPAQQWLRRGDALVNPNSGRCLDAPGGATANGTRLQLWDCNGLAPQRFPFVTAVDHPPQLRAGSTVSLRVTTPGFTDRYLRHRNFLAVTSVLDTGSAEPDRRDATFRVQSGLADPTCVSLAAVNIAGAYLRHRDFRVRLESFTDTALFRADATFCPESAPGGVRLRSVNLTDRYLRHYDAAGYVAEPGGGNAFDNPAHFDDDTVWQPTGPLAP